ncbi:hypothetical protein CQW23_24462 [Capsicum baccatum]|uniref:Uncharacterized protein n=1 Tax=Capsicum baccatum TaxID=33114 RepID=A0A2G2VUY4_CAPBA|nr:hypothetical protein CQW23_24462 [Capsicum baccatum]
MRGTGRGRSERGGAARGRGRGNFREYLSSDTTSHPQIQPIGVVGTSLETGQLSNPSEGPMQTQQKQRGPIQRTSPETQSSRNLDESLRLSVEAEIGTARLHVIYSSYNNDKDRSSHHLEDVDLDDWKHLVEYFDSDKFKRNPLTGEKETSDKIWEIQHTRKNVNGECVWLDPQSEQIHGQLQKLVVEQQSKEIELRMTGDEILTSVLGEKSGYVWGKGYNKPTKKNQT